MTYKDDIYHSQQSTKLLYYVGNTVPRSKVDPNFWARYTYGNRINAKGLKCLHLNIRSLGQKVVEIKNIIQEKRPHIFGISDCELKKVNGTYDESRLKIPGYNVLFPKSWAVLGYCISIRWKRS